ncbi:MAG: hypothetical protein FWH37_07895 [Candidatus Bathyarchaeota archaeon]|nr:hypothetical protein [Candidatus Termiticorpusculum sp.]
MNTAENTSSGGDGCGCWVEVRPLITSELETANFVSVLDALYNLAKPYRFLIADTKNSEGSEQHQLVRFYFQFSDEQTRKQMSNIIRALIDVEVVAATPPTQQYNFSIDLELSKNYALPITNTEKQKDTQANIIDRIVASLAGTDTCIEITTIADPNAALGIQKFVYEKMSHKQSVSKTFLDSFTDFIGTAAGKTIQNEKSKGKPTPYKIDPWVKECIKYAETKLSSSLFTCQIVIHGNSLKDIQAVKNALPAAMNRFRGFKTNKNKPHQQTSALRKPSRYKLRNNVLCHLWWIVPLSTLLIAGLLGLFNPLKVISSGNSLDLVLLVLTGFFAVCLFMLFRKRQPIVLSAYELAQIVGLPLAVEKLPIALGKVPISRMQLDIDQINDEEPKNNRLIAITEDE